MGGMWTSRPMMITDSILVSAVSRNEDPAPVVSGVGLVFSLVGRAPIGDGHTRWLIRADRSPLSGPVTTHFVVGPLVVDVELFTKVQ